ncbi:MAG: hypothetical protein F6K17_10035 [Okeania sp. SIO3C4]|nr:hypothetical protein [Okeania sp. SIO3B3]NER02938.1 hypothetical protein [Okeania sp. SIO3C4]
MVRYTKLIIAECLHYLEIYQTGLGRATPPFKGKYFWSEAQITATKITSDF